MQNLEPWNSKTIVPGQTFGRLTVLSTHRKIGTYAYYAYCRCSCGSDPRYVQTGALRNGTIGSCGCLHREVVTKHGAWGNPLYGIWRGMMSRCTKPSDKRYSRYGGRGINVCRRWRDATAFIEDMTPTFRKGLQLDRIDNDGDYSPENCRWATTGEQTRNYSRNVSYTLRGTTKCLADWVSEYNSDYRLVWERLKRGWDIETALTAPKAK